MEFTAKLAQAICLYPPLGEIPHIRISCAALRNDTVFSMLGRYAHRGKSLGGSTHGPIDPVQMPEEARHKTKRMTSRGKCAHG
jgi:hypothetical protein